MALKPSKANKYFWSPEEDDTLRRMWEANAPMSEIVDAFSGMRSEQAIYMRGRNIGLKPREAVKNPVNMRQRRERRGKPSLPPVPGVRF